ncbi:MAG: carbohydrate-binding protein [Tannerella sp.]|nr:carbohydrate-binding protein [Tannerella sp.]
MNDLHDEYLEGEIIYAAKVDSASVYPGMKRAALNTLIHSQRIETVRIYWNDYSDSTDIVINNQVGEFSKLLENIEEKDYIFYLVSLDKFGNRSLPFEVSGSVYGDRFKNGLTGRAILSINATDENLTVNWGGTPDNAIYSELVYKDGEGNRHTLRIPLSETSTSFTDWSSIDSSRTVFLPGANALDTLYSEWRIAPPVRESTPFNGPHILSAAAPCEIQARDFDYGGEGLAFHETSNRTPNSSYRTEAGDELSKTVDVYENSYIAYINPGEWLVYTVDVQDAGLYAADVRLTVNSSSGGAFYFSADGIPGEMVVVPNNGSWDAWLWAFERYPDLIQPTFRLSAGKHKIRFTIGPGGYNLMGFKFTRISD